MFHVRLEADVVAKEKRSRKNQCEVEGRHEGPGDRGIFVQQPNKGVNSGSNSEEGISDAVQKPAKDTKVGL